MLPGFVLSDASQARHRNYAEADSTDEENRGLLPGFVLSDAAQARHRNYAEADLTEKAKRIRASPFLLNLVELMGFEPTAYTLRTYRSSQLS